MRNDNSIQMEVMCEFVLGVKNTFRLFVSSSSFASLSSGTISASTRSILTLATVSLRCIATSRCCTCTCTCTCTLEQVLAKEVLEEQEVLDIKAVITFKGKVRGEGVTGCRLEAGQPLGEGQR